MPTTSGRHALLNLPLHVLLALAEGERHGWSVIKRIEELTAGTQSPSSDSLYLAITRLEERGLIEEAPRPEEEVDERRRYYRLTKLGREVLQSEVRRSGSRWAAHRRVCSRRCCAFSRCGPLFHRRTRGCRTGWS